ncbi:MAG: hypothetical protein KY450_05745 [Actinobacteria bacterium]|nr:hypothetical protein [Actinomycetota bacterium]
MDTLLANATINVPAHFSVLGGSGREFSEALDAMRAELAPVGLVEGLLVDQVMLAASRLRSIVAAEGDAETTAALLSQAEQIARSILQDNGARLAALAERLMHDETLSVAQMAAAAGLPDPAQERLAMPDGAGSPIVDASSSSVTRLHG